MDYDKVKKAVDIFLSPESKAKVKVEEPKLRVPGVYPHASGNKWFAQVRVLGKNIHIGMFDSIEEASRERRFIQFWMEQNPSVSMFAWLRNKKKILKIVEQICADPDVYLRGFEMSDEEREKILCDYDILITQEERIARAYAMQQMSKLERIKAKPMYEVTDADMEYVLKHTPIPSESGFGEKQPKQTKKFTLREVYFDDSTPHEYKRYWFYTWQDKGVVCAGQCRSKEEAEFMQIDMRYKKPVTENEYPKLTREDRDIAQAKWNIQRIWVKRDDKVEIDGELYPVLCEVDLEMAEASKAHLAYVRAQPNYQGGAEEPTEDGIPQTD